MMSLERHQEPLLPRRLFIHRFLRWATAAALVLGISLAAGVCGYHYFGSLGWLDSLLNASMILGGMGPVNPINGRAGKLFASFYALYSGLALISITGLLLTPVVHRAFHIFHLPQDKG